MLFSTTMQWTTLNSEYRICRVLSQYQYHRLQRPRLRHLRLTLSMHWHRLLVRSNRYPPLRWIQVSQHLLRNLPMKPTVRWHRKWFFAPFQLWKVYWNRLFSPKPSIAYRIRSVYWRSGSNTDNIETSTKLWWKVFELCPSKFGCKSCHSWLLESIHRDHWYINWFGISWSTLAVSIRKLWSILWWWHRNPRLANEKPLPIESSIRWESTAIPLSNKRCSSARS